MGTIASRIWRGLVASADWRATIRKGMSKGAVDAVFISNMRDKIDRKRYLGKNHPECGHFNGNRYWVEDVSGRIRILDRTTDELATAEGREKARTFFIDATGWARRNGARVVLLAASTKRLFGEDGKALKKRFPDVLFTIGDNGTFWVLQAETLNALQSAGLAPESARIGVLGPYGLLGEMIVGTLTAKGFALVGAGPNTAALQDIGRQYGIETCQHFEQMGKVDAVVACTHSEQIRLTAEAVNTLKRRNKLLVVDVAEPSNLRYREYLKCRDSVIRQDAGNAYSPRLKNVLGAASYRMLRLTRGVAFGCFAEALALAHGLKNGMEADIRVTDWFSVNADNMAKVEALFQPLGFTIPSPRCFGKPIGSFNLDG